MAKVIKEHNAKIPDYALSYLVNGDDSGLNFNDKGIIDSFVTRYTAMFTNFVSIDFCPSEEEGSFSWHPEFGLPCNVVECDIVVVVNH